MGWLGKSGSNLFDGFNQIYRLDQNNRYGWKELIVHDSNYRGKMLTLDNPDNLIASRDGLIINAVMGVIDYPIDHVLMHCCTNCRDNYPYRRMPITTMLVLKRAAANMAAHNIRPIFRDRMNAGHGLLTWGSRRRMNITPAP